MARVKNRPNVIVFLTDQQRWDTVGAYGNPLGLTPNFDAIARRGTFFQYAFTPQPLCTPARAALQTGLYPTTVGCYRNGLSLSREARTLAHHFRDSGYRTGYIGKWHLSEQDPVPVEARGGYEDWLAANALGRDTRPYGLRLFNGEGKEVRLPGYRVDAVVDAAIRHVDTVSHEHAGDPFFLFISVLEPHQQNDVDQFIAPEAYDVDLEGWCPPDLERLVGSSRLHLPGYLGAIRRIDEALGRLLEAMKSLELLDRTVFLFTSDHGCHFKTRNGEYKRSCHEASIRIPMAAQGPGFNGKGVVTDLVSLIDVPAMLMGAAGVDVPSGVLGRRLEGRHLAADGDNEAILVQISEAEVGRALRTRRWKYGVTATHVDPRRTGSANRYLETSLYDLESDPWELCNRVADPGYRDVREGLRRQLVRRLNDIGEIGVEIDEGRSRLSGDMRL